MVTVKLEKLAPIVRSVLLNLSFGLLTAASAYAAPGDLDPTFGVDPVDGPGSFGAGVFLSDRSEGAGYARGITLQGDGKIVIALGHSWNVQRLLPDGLPDDSFGFDSRVTLGAYNLFDIAIRSDANIIAAGYGFNVDGSYEYHGVLARFASGAGGYDVMEREPFSGPERAFRRIVATADDRLVVGGVQYARKKRFVIIRYFSHGELDRSFGRRGRVRVGRLVTLDGVSGLALDPDGGVVAVGTDYSGRVSADIAVVRYGADGRADRGFGRRGRVITERDTWDQAYDVALQADGKILVAGTIGQDHISPRFALLRYLADGQLDPGFGTGGIVVTDFGGESEAYAVAVQADGKIVVAGEADDTFALARYLADGSLDPSFGSGGTVVSHFPGSASAEAVEMVIDGDGRILLAGYGCLESPPVWAPQTCYFPLVARYLAE